MISNFYFLMFLLFMLFVCLFVFLNRTIPQGNLSGFCTIEEVTPLSLKRLRCGRLNTAVFVLGG